MDNRRSEYEKAIAARGLSVSRFDGHTLLLKYDPAQDGTIRAGQGVEISNLGAFAINTMNGYLDGPELYPGLKNVTVDSF